jgi:hypothetical protein
MNGSISMGELSHLIVRSFGLSGGFMYGLFPGPRYAYRALVWRRFLPLNADPGRTVSGEELLYITGRVLSYAGDGELPPASAAEETPDTRLNVEQGQGLSSGPEELQPYTGEFEVD